MENKIKNIHFVGIGGSGMSGIAEVMHNLRFKVQGSDLGKSEAIQRLKKLGIKVFNKHLEKNVIHSDNQNSIYFVHDNPLFALNMHVKNRCVRNIKN